MLRDFLPGSSAGSWSDLLLAGDRRYYTPSGNPFIPLEFADAAYRYGHAQIRHTYRLNDAALAEPIFPDLIGFGPITPERRVQWARLFDADGQSVGSPGEKDRRHAGWRADRATCDTDRRIAVQELHSLAVRDLERGQRVGLPSGEAVARHMGVRRSLATKWAPAPLVGATKRHSGTTFFARRGTGGGHRLGPVGGRIVGEVLVGPLDLDPGSVRHAPSDWKPQASLIDLLMGLVWVKG